MAVRVGVLSLQGDVSEHVEAFRAALARMGLDGRARVIQVRDAAALAACDAVAIPGGESTAIGRMAESRGMADPLRSFGGAFFLTCAGLVLGSRAIESGAGERRPRVEPLGILDIGVKRNAFGRQRDSFEADLQVEGIPTPFHAVFIRAPLVTSVGPKARAISRLAEGVVGVEQGLHMGFSFHPELAGDLRLHILFLERLIANA